MTGSWRILVTGSRDWDDEQTLHRQLAAAVAEAPSGVPALILHGACPAGADLMADTWARNHGVPVERQPADWRRFGKRAGFIRNAEMVSLEPARCLAFIKDGSRGATHCAGLAEKAGIPTRRTERGRRGHGQDMLDFTQASDTDGPPFPAVSQVLDPRLDPRASKTCCCHDPAIFGHVTPCPKLRS